MLKLSDLKGSVIKPGLETVSELLGRLGNPQLAYKTVHIAGTNGKGSTAAMLRDILMKSGYRTGFYSSPHLHTFNERVTLDAEQISDSDLEKLEEEVGSVCDGLEPTYFEFTTAIAFKYFAEKRPDIVLVEVGLGGRLDATNLVNPLLTIITPVSMDHQEFLGNNIASVAREKAGILKKGVKAVISRQPSEVMEVVRARAEEVGAPLMVEGANFETTETGYPLFNYRGASLHLENLRCGLIGRHQLQNSAMALASAECLTEKGFQLNEKAVRQALVEVRWPGRLELIEEIEPQVLLDGTHNPGGARVLADALADHFPDRPVRLIIGMQVTKDLKTFLSILKPHIGGLHAVPLRDMACYEPSEVARVAVEMGMEATAHQTVAQALESAVAEAGENGLVLAAGSLYLVGEIRELIDRNG